MTPERFQHLANAYGADIQRWPASEQAGAQVLMRSANPAVSDALRQARWLDGQLDSHLLAPVPGDLARRIAATAVRQPAPPSFWSRHLDWLPRIGFVGAGLAGIGAGMLVVSLGLPLRSAADALPSIFEQSDAEIVLSLNVEEMEQ